MYMQREIGQLVACRNRPILINRADDVVNTIERVEAYFRWGCGKIDRLLPIDPKNKNILIFQRGWERDTCDC